MPNDMKRLALTLMGYLTMMSFLKHEPGSSEVASKRRHERQMSMGRTGTCISVHACVDMQMVQALGQPLHVSLRKLLINIRSCSVSECFRSWSKFNTGLCQLPRPLIRATQALGLPLHVLGSRCKGCVLKLWSCTVLKCFRMFHHGPTWNHLDRLLSTTYLVHVLKHDAIAAISSYCNDVLGLEVIPPPACF